MGSGERLHGMQEVRGSIPLISTKKSEPFGSDFFFCFIFALTQKAATYIKAAAFVLYRSQASFFIAQYPITMVHTYAQVFGIINIPTRGYWSAKITTGM